MSYNPSDYIKDYRIIARAAQDVAGGVIGFSEEQKQKKQRQEELDIEYKKAEKLASENKNLINTSYKTIRSIASREIDELIKLGSLDEKTGQDMLKTLVKPDKFTTFKDYSTVTGTAFDDLMAKIAKLKEKAVDTGIKQTLEGTDQQPAIGFQNPETEAVSGDLSSSMADLNKAAESVQAPAAQGPWAELGEEQQPAIPRQGPVQTMQPQQPAQIPTKEEGMRKLAGQVTMDEGKKSMYLQSLKSEEDIAKEKQQLTKAKLEEEKLKISKIKLGLSQDKESNINWYREQVIKYKGMAQKLNEAKDDLSREKARADLVDNEIAIRSLISDSEKELKEMQNKVNEFDQPVPEDTIETAKKKTEIEDLKLLLREFPNLKMQTIKKGTTVNMKTGEVSPAAIPSPTPAPRQTQPAPAPAAAAPNLPPVTADTVIGKTDLPGSQKSTVPQYESIEDVKAAKSSGKLKVGDKVRVVINGKLTLIRVK